MSETQILESGVDGSVVQRTVLPNGLRVITERVPASRSVTVGLWVGVGSRDEDRPAVIGAAHYLEHLLFKGTSRRNATQIAEEIDAVGGEINAFTAKEHTCFHAQVLAEDLPLAVDLVTDVVFRAQCADSDVETERSVVLEEIAMRDDDPEDLLHELLAESLLATHPLGRSILGTEQSIDAMTGRSLREFYAEQYTLPRMVLVVTGKVDHAKALDLARKALADRLSNSDSPAAGRQENGFDAGQRQLILRQDDTEQTHLMLGVPTFSRHDKRRYALGVLNAALGGGMSSRLFQEIREQRGLAYQVYSSTASYADAGYLMIYAGCQPNRLGEVTAVLRDLLARVSKDGFTEEEITRAKGQLRGGMVLGLEDNSARMSRLGEQELNYGDYRPVDDLLGQIDAVTTEQVNELAGELLRGGVHTAAVVGPYAHEDELPADLHEVIAS